MLLKFYLRPLWILAWRNNIWQIFPSFVQNFQENIGIILQIVTKYFRSAFLPIHYWQISYHRAIHNISFWKYFKQRVNITSNLKCCLSARSNTDFLKSTSETYTRTTFKTTIVTLLYQQKHVFQLVPSSVFPSSFLPKFCIKLSSLRYKFNFNTYYIIEQNTKMQIVRSNVY